MSKAIQVGDKVICTIDSLVGDYIYEIGTVEDIEVDVWFFLKSTARVRYESGTVFNLPVEALIKYDKTLAGAYVKTSDFLDSVDRNFNFIERFLLRKKFNRLGKELFDK